MSALRLPSGLLEEIPPFHSRSLSEDTLFRGHRIEGDSYASPPSPVVEPCACGTPVVALSTADADVLLAVRAHQRLPEHQLYRHRTGVL